jgi:hypothetical protein
VRGQKIEKGYRWTPSEDHLFYIMGFLLEHNERPGNTFKAWVWQNRKTNTECFRNISEAYALCAKVAQFCGYSQRWVTDEVDRLTAVNNDEYFIG